MAKGLRDGWRRMWSMVVGIVWADCGVGEVEVVVLVGVRLGI